MKEVKAIIKPFKVNDILNQLLEAGYPNLTVALAEGTGNFKDVDSSISTHFSITDSKVAIIVIICADSEVETLLVLFPLPDEQEILAMVLSMFQMLRKFTKWVPVWEMDRLIWV